MKVVFFHRKPRPIHNFSVENLFSEIRASFDSRVNSTIKEVSYYSEGFFKRIYISVEAALNQGEINHVTGDIHFVTILLKKKKTLLTVLDLGFMQHPNPVARLILKWFWIDLPVRRAGVVTTISEATKREVLKYVKINPDKIKVVYVPILKNFKQYPKPFNKRCPVILQLGTKANKNLNRLIEAIAGIPCKLDVVGELDEETVRQLKVQRIDYINSFNLSNEQVLYKYRNADLISFVSTYEGFGMPIVEANAIGRAVITSNILSMPEVAGNAAHLVDPFNVEDIRDGIKKLIADDIYRETLIQNGFKNHLRFDSRTIASQYADIYEGLYNAL